PCRACNTPCVAPRGGEPEPLAMLGGGPRDFGERRSGARREREVTGRIVDDAGEPFQRELPRRLDRPACVQPSAATNDAHRRIMGDRVVDKLAYLGRGGRAKGRGRR